MTSTTRIRRESSLSEAGESLTWRAWPLVEQLRWAWIVPVGMIAIGVAIWYLDGGRLLAVAAIVGLAITLRQFLLPINYEVASLGIRRHVWRHSRLVPWHAVRAYQLRPTGVVFYQRNDPTKFDLLRSLFVPYPAEPDELIGAIRPHLLHAVELP
jgi:hypothetical protein